MLKIRRAFQESFSVKTPAARILGGKVITGKLFTKKVVRSSIAFPPRKSSPSQSFFNFLISQILDTTIGARCKDRDTVSSSHKAIGSVIVQLVVRL